MILDMAQYDETVPRKRTLPHDSFICGVSICKTNRVSAHRILPALEEDFCAQLERGEAGAALMAWPNVEKLSDVSVHGLRSEELGVVENVEAFEAKLQRFRFRQAHVLQEGHIVVVHSGAVEEAPLGGAGRAQGVFRERRGIEVRPPVARIGVEIEGTSCE